MNISGESEYCNRILEAIIVNSDYNNDPEHKYRLQIYIPSVQYEYMLSDDKTTSPHKDKFPWAVSLVDGLENGNTVYISNINNKFDKYIILGAQANAESNYSRSLTSGGVTMSDVYNISSSGLIDLCMPIIVHNEVGTAIEAWPDNIPDSYYTKINPEDNGGWSIGLIQWHHTRAYDVLYYITQQDPDWRNYWSDKSLDLYIDLDRGNQNARLKYQQDFHPTPGTALYDGIQRMLSSDKGKLAQRLYASNDIAASIAVLQDSSNDIHNEAIVIYLADIMNQYGNNIPQTVANASRIDRDGKGVMEQLDEFVAYCRSSLGNFNTYINRRNETYSYVSQLNASSKFITAGLSDSSPNSSVVMQQAIEGNVIIGNGQYGYPFEGSAMISATYGINGYHNYNRANSGYHSGVDFAMPIGRPLRAVTSGTIKTLSSYGRGISIMADDGNMIIYGHCDSWVVGNGQRVERGQHIANSGNTGNSSGPHLHFEIVTAPYKFGSTRSGGDNSVNPLPFIGLSGSASSYYDQSVNF